MTKVSKKVPRRQVAKSYHKNRVAKIDDLINATSYELVGVIDYKEVNDNAGVTPFTLTDIQVPSDSFIQEVILIKEVDLDADSISQVEVVNPSLGGVSNALFTVKVNDDFSLFQPQDNSQGTDYEVEVYTANLGGFLGGNTQGKFNIYMKLAKKPV